MKFDDGFERASFEYLLDSVFNYIPAGFRTRGDFAGEPYSEFWWREVAEDEDRYGTKGYVMVWFDGNHLNTSHGYRHPETIFE